MKKIQLLILGVLLILLGSCSKAQVDAELTYLDENKVEQIYTIKKTENLEEVKKLVQIIKEKKFDGSFNGIHFNLKGNLEGKAVLTLSEKKTIDLAYTLDVDAKTNLKKYQVEGTILLDGRSTTNSPSLSLTTRDQLKGKLTNDDDFLYISGDAKTGNTQVKVKHKINIRDFTDDYKAKIISILDVLKHYKFSEIISNMEEFVDLYHITIKDTTKDTFTIRVNVPSNFLYPEEDILENIPIDIKVSCDRLLPLKIDFLLDDFISKSLQNEYIKKYLSDKVEIEAAKGNLTIELEYGTYNIKEITEQEKQEYKEYKR